MALNIVLWTLQVPVALAFIAAGSAKLLGECGHDRALRRRRHRSVVPLRHGVLEVLGALLLLVPGKAVFGAALLACVMAGAVMSHLTVLTTPVTPALVLLALTVLIAWGRRSQLAGLLDS